jgi:hypothetical protein
MQTTAPTREMSAMAKIAKTVELSKALSLHVVALP